MIEPDERGYPAPFIDEGLKKVRFETGPNGEQIEVWPCKGHEHRGEYAIYDYGHCNCPHENYPAMFLMGPEYTDDESEWSIMCVGCGAVFDWETCDAATRARVDFGRARGPEARDASNT